MGNPLQTIGQATAKAVSTRNHVAAFLAVSAVLWLLFVLVPVWTTPGDDFLFHLQITPLPTHLLMIVLALGNALLLFFHLHIRRQHKGGVGVKAGAHSLGSLASSVLATLGCASCYSSIISVFGIGGVTFIGEYRWLIALAAITITFAALYLTANRIQHGCKVCHV